MFGVIDMPTSVHNAHRVVKSKRTPLLVQNARAMIDHHDEGKRLRRAREKHFPSAKEAARFHGWSYDTYAQHENGTRGIKKAVAQYARAFRVSEGWLLTGEGSPDGPTPAIEVPVISWVSAGQLVTPETVLDATDAPILLVSDLPASGDWIALDVVGDSMDRISPPGSRIIVSRKERKLVPNACYVISTDGGEATYKRYRPSPERFEPVSTNPIHEPLFPSGPVIIIGRVRKTILDM